MTDPGVSLVQLPTQKKHYIPFKWQLRPFWLIAPVVSKIAPLYTFESISYPNRGTNSVTDRGDKYICFMFFTIPFGENWKVLCYFCRLFKYSRFKQCNFAPYFVTSPIRFYMNKSWWCLLRRWNLYSVRS